MFVKRRRHALEAALGAGSLLVALAVLVPHLAGWDTHVGFPPVSALWRPRVGPGTVPALLVAGLAAWQAVPWALRARWRTLLVVSFLAGATWMFALALVDGPGGVGTVLTTSFEYLPSAHRIHDVHRMLQEYVSRIPLHSRGAWPVHLAGHPPGAVLFFVALVHLGLGSGFAAGCVVTVVAATTAVAVLLTLAVLGAGEHARRAAPFLVLGPAAVWQSVSADAVFAAVAAWGTCALALAATRTHLAPRLGWSALAGLLLGYCQLLSYGLPVLGVLAVAVLVAARDLRPLVPTALAAAGVVLVFAALGFSWWEAFPVLRARYWAGIAPLRSGWYWSWGDLAALTLSAGPLVWPGVVATWQARREGASRVPVLLVGAGLTMVLLADASQMSRAEVERIWLPFVPWLLVGTALLPERWRRRGLALQLVTALLVQHLLATTW